jgi:REP element-mobilizing transposase RayT
MPDNLFRNKYRIPSARAVWHDYNGGAYFVTICTKDMAHFFGEIVDGEMCLTEIGRCADEQFRNVSSHYPYAKIPLWVVMPNHVHAIVMIDGDLQNREKMDVETMCTSSVQQTSINQSRWKNESLNERMQTISQKRGLLSITIGGIKRAVTCYANIHGISFAWQTRFHDRIIRDCDEMNGIAQYIENNVAKWESDEMNDE